MGRRPNLSLRFPSMGEKINCIMANENISHPLYTEALLRSPPARWLMYFGRIGMMIPNPITSKRRVMKMNPNAGFLVVDIALRLIFAQRNKLLPG